jgi:hypothetical protein
MGNPWLLVIALRFTPNRTGEARLWLVVFCNRPDIETVSVLVIGIISKNLKGQRRANAATERGESIFGVGPGVFP